MNYSAYDVSVLVKKKYIMSAKACRSAYDVSVL